MTDLIWAFCSVFRVLLSVCLILIQGSSYMNYGEVLIVLTFTGRFCQGNTFFGIFVLVQKIPPRNIYDDGGGFWILSPFWIIQLHKIYMIVWIDSESSHLQWNMHAGIHLVCTLACVISADTIMITMYMFY